MRQSMAPVQFNKTRRVDQGNIRSSGRAGVVHPVGFMPVLPGDSVGGSVGMDIRLAEMPRPLDVGVYAKAQAWFYPKSADPRFSGRDELIAAMDGSVIKALGQSNRTPPSYFQMLGSGSTTIAANSDLFKALGIHLRPGVVINSDLIDAFVTVYNFRLAAISNALIDQRMPYAMVNTVEATKLPPAPWPNNDFMGVVSDYERALVVGSLDLDVLAGSLPVTGWSPVSTATTNSGPVTVKKVGGGTETWTHAANSNNTGGNSNYARLTAALTPDLRAELAGQKLFVTLADIDKARTRQAFAKLRNAYAGTEFTGYDNDDAIVSLLMQGIDVPQDEFRRPWLLDSQTVPVNYVERMATDGASLDQSSTTGGAAIRLATNLPKQDVGGVIIYTVEVLPERLHERMGDDYFHYSAFDDLPNAMRDVQRVEPVDQVLNYHVDAKHTAPGSVYGFRPMNDHWNRRFTRLGGVFYEPVPGAEVTESRMGVWHSDIVDPVMDEIHYLAPVPFPHGVFADTLAPAFEVTSRHVATITGLTQIGDVLLENNDDYEAVAAAGQE